MALDLLGFGHSDKPEHFSYTLSEQADALHVLLDLLGLSRVVFLGHSLGGSIGVVFAEKYAARLAGLILAEGGLESQYLTLARWAGRKREDEFRHSSSSCARAPPAKCSADSAHSPRYR